MPTLNLPKVSYDYLRERAEAFLREHRAWGSVPVPIEDIIDLRMKIDIIPLPGLLRSFNIDAFLSSDCRSITVDESVYEHRVPHRYRFSLAHEVGHAVLHRPIFTALEFNTIRQYKRTLAELTDFDVNRMEWQAYSFAGLILVPSPDLATHFAVAIQRAEAAGISVADYWDEAVAYISNALVSVFKVSDQVISRRIEYDNLRARLTKR